MAMKGNEMALYSNISQKLRSKGTMEEVITELIWRTMR